ncbi:MAG: TetR family transcriptional regulator C-terminal domain-containing protein [Gammaproteobacteria bacterium]|nr:TetR family transcriptional regulator C-terminal domain-containing protein [Gammaproteobacteria bacterium]MBV9698126.1 TetR family transcriptional regulator C-terminal domain-containing protein [Gammaproteobacteria bacterium]
MGAQRSSNSNSPPRGGSRIRQRQRQRLIDACISALHIYGPSRTTVEKVVALADLSPGIVRFYFSSKAAMLLASLAHLAAEFDERVLQPVARLRDTPVEALRLLVDLYLDADIASPRKVSVWYSFWGEASSRQEYFDLCGKKDDDFAALVRDLIERLIQQSGARHLDADAVALGLIGVLEVLWQGFAFQSEANIDRRSAVQRSLAYLRSVFPSEFAASPAASAAPAAPAGDGARLPAAAYASASVLAAERERLLRPAWQLLGHESELQRAGDYLTGDLGGERVLVVRGGRGHVLAFRNTCRRSPHALLSARRGHLQSAIRCGTHDLTYTFEGHLVEGRTPGDLPPLPLLNADGLIFARGDTAVAAAELPSAWAALGVLRPGAVHDFEVAADWKVLIEQWLESTPPGGEFLAPNQLLLREGPAAVVLQVLPVAPGSARVRRFELTAAAPRSAARRSAWQRRLDHWLKEQLVLAASTQAGLLSGATAEDAGPIGSQLGEFRRAVGALLRALS